MGLTTRLLEVAPERLPGWVARFGEAHGPVVAEPDADGTRLRLTAPDGAVAELEVAWPPVVPAVGGDPVAALAAHAASPRTALVVLARRGGWAVGLAREGAVLTGAGGALAAAGTRYVQSRTAAGGWSQQRYARRRANQADGLVGAAAEGLARVISAAGAAGHEPEVLVHGGDRLLVAEVVAQVPDAVRALPAGPLLDVPDPRRRVLDEVATRARAVRVRVSHPA